MENLLEDMTMDRAGFLKLAGFTWAGFLIGKSNVHKVVPYLAQPEEVTPGEAIRYATVCGGCGAACGVLAKDRAGRPVNLEGNPDHPLNRGGLCAAGQASILGLYDDERLAGPTIAGKGVGWDALDGALRSELDRVAKAGGAVCVLTHTVVSPTLRGRLETFLAGFPGGRHVEYDPLSASAILDAHAVSHGRRILPRYRFGRADLTVSFEADFLGTWISPVEFTRGFSEGRRLDGRRTRFSRLVQVESRMTVTGSKADERWMVAPEESPLVVAHLARLLGASVGTLPPCPVSPASLRDLALDLERHRGRSLVVSGDNRLETQVLVNWINARLGNYGTTLDLVRPSLQRQGRDGAVTDLLADMASGKVAALIVAGANPVYELPEGARFADLFRHIAVSVDCATGQDETTALARFVTPDLHWLESWGDAEPVRGMMSVRQPAIQPMGHGRAFLESLAAWSGRPATALEQVQAHWKREVFPRRRGGGTFDTFWNRALDEGCVETDTGAAGSPTWRESALRMPVRAPRGPTGLALVLYAKVGPLDGRHAGNPWLQELPDPVSKVTWDNYASMAPDLARRLGVKAGDVVRLTCDGAAPVLLPVQVQPGQHPGCVAVALGYGAVSSRRFSRIGPQWLQGGPTVGADGLVGVNAAPLLHRRGGEVVFQREGLVVERTRGRRELACTQAHESLAVPDRLVPQGGARQPLVREMTLAEYRAPSQEAKVERPASLYAEREFPGRRWGMAIDLTACTGCSACVVACQVENNVPVVGRGEVQRSREMHWIRIDRYYAESRAGVDVVHEPMLCQQCGNAPCESVCPVSATVTSEEGLNEQVYNRCVGTRYCNNNCPYKVRRFNWFNYPREHPRENLVLNPDVTVRSRGVMEKCTFCVQRIQAAKADSARTGTPIKDGTIRTACQQVCPADAIVFGDLNDPRSRVARLAADRRSFRVLGELNVRPAIAYLALVRNRTS